MASGVQRVRNELGGDEIVRLGMGRDGLIPLPYAARFGWVSIDFEEPIDLKELGALLVQSYREVALKRMLTELDGRDRIGKSTKRKRK